MLPKDRMTPIMKPGDPTVYPMSRISQLGVGELEISCMAYTVPDYVRFHHEITLQAHSEAHPEGWGEAIFKGTLKELIELVQGKEVNDGIQKHS